jgi:protein O-mannosyl-transferase
VNRRAFWLAVLAILTVTFVACAPALRNGFIWDDDDHFTQNPAMTRPDGLQKIWSSLAFSRYYPLTLTTFWVERQLWGLNPIGYHALNIALQALSAVLLFLLLRRLKLPGAWVTAMLWAVHPVNVESVAWATELKNIQSGMFFFLSLLCFLRFEEQPRAKWYGLSLLTFACALLSKSSTVILPWVLLLLVWWQRRCLLRRDLWRATPFFAMSLAMSLLTITEQHGHIDRAPHDWSLNLAERFIVAGKDIWFYAGKVLWPVDLMFVYPQWSVNTHSLFEWLPLAGVAAVGVGLWRMRRHEWAPTLGFGLGYFVVALLPVLGFFDIYYFRYSFVSDHFQYLASVGPIALLVACAAKAIPSREARMTTALLVVCALMTMTWRYTQVFSDDATLWLETLARNPNAELAHTNMGIILDLAGQHDSAAEQYREALRIKPNYVEAHANLGMALTDLKQYKQAEQEFQEALRIMPKSSNAYYGLGTLYYREGRLEDAVTEYETALLIDPSMAETYYNLGCVRQQQGQRTIAIACFKAALVIRPNYPDAQKSLAKMLADPSSFVP